MKTNKSKYIPTKNYVIIAVVIALVIFLALYIFKWINVKEQEEYLESYLISTNTISRVITSFEELENILIEQQEHRFIFTGYTLDEEVYNLEEDLKPIIDEYALEDKFYYFDITNLMNEEDFEEKFEEIIGTDLTSTPIIIYYLDSKVTTVLESDGEGLLKASAFTKLLEINGFEKSN